MTRQAVNNISDTYVLYKRSVRYAQSYFTQPHFSHHCFQPSSSLHSSPVRLSYSFWAPVGQFQVSPVMPYP